CNALRPFCSTRLQFLLAVRFDANGKCATLPDLPRGVGCAPKQQTAQSGGFFPLGWSDGTFKVIAFRAKHQLSPRRHIGKRPPARNCAAHPVPAAALNGLANFVMGRPAGNCWALVGTASRGRYVM